MEMMYPDAQEMSCLVHVQRRHQEKGCLICDVKLAKKAWIARGQRIDHTFEFQVQAMSGEKLPFILHAVVCTAIAPRTDDDDDKGLRYDDDNLCHHFNDLVIRGIIERETRALAASMNMEDIFWATTSSSINHQAVIEFENVQLQLKHLGRIIVYDANVYVKPQFADVSGNEDFSYVVAEDDGARQTAKVEEEVQSSAEGGSNQEGRPSKMGEIMGWACQSLKPQILQVVYGNDTIDGQLKQQIKFLSSYSLKALWFAMPMFYASLTHHYSTSTAFSVGDTLFLVAIIIDAALILLLPKWGNALVCISWLVLELATCLVSLSFNKHYAFTILAVLLLLLLVALLQPKLQHAADRHVLPSFTQDMIGDDEESPHLGHLLDLSQGIASFGGLVTAIAGHFSLVTAIAGHFMVGPVNAVGFFFFCAIALGLYLSMVVTVGAVSRPHAKCLAIIVMVLVVLTFIAACIPFVGQSGSKPQVVA